MLKLLSVIGTRPQAIKAAAIHSAVKDYDDVEHSIVHSGQHYDPEIDADILASAGIDNVEINFGVGSGSHAEVTSKIMLNMEKFLIANSDRIDWVLNYGDTNTTLGVALACAKLCVPSAHIESGLRRYDLTIPEEVNRKVTDHISNVLFASSEQYVKNLAREAVQGEVLNVGDINCDSFRQMAEKVRPENGDFVYCTIHRPVNTDSREALSRVIDFLSNFSEEILLPLHPRTVSLLKKYDLEFSNNVKVIKPVSFDRSVALILGAKFVITDSGGLQKEAYFGRKKCITLSLDTPWIELKEHGVNLPLFKALETRSFEDIYEWAQAPFSAPDNIYGDGKSAYRIINWLANKEAV